MEIINKNGHRAIIVGKGESMTITNGKTYINGKEVDLAELANKREDSNVYHIHIEGDVDKLEVDHCETISVNGNVRKIHTSYGSIEIKGDVDGDVHTNMGDIECGNVDGDVHTNMGSIRYRKDSYKL